MKPKLIIGISIPIIVGISLVFSFDSFFDFRSGEQHQYKFWQENVDFGNGIWYDRVLFSYSNDYGLTFSKPVDMSMTNQNAHEPKMIQMNDEIILVWRDEAPDDLPDLSFAKSIDFGKNFDKKRLFHGARPDIKYFDNTIYLAFMNMDDPNVPKVLYSKSNDNGETFSKPQLLFQTDWELSPYEDRPTPTLDVDADKVTITWKMEDKDDNYTLWTATDYGKDGTFEISNSPTQRD